MLFIDANIYLDFYSTTQPSLRKLLPALKELRPQIVIPKQIADEVARNAVKKLGESLAEWAKKMSVANVSLPEQHDSVGTGSVQAWNQRHQKLREEAKLLEADLVGLMQGMLIDVQHGRDPVSQAFAEIFAGAIAPSSAILSAARERREHGNPPGKQSDPLGDQLSWETLLSALKPGADLWLVTRDGDYGYRDGRCLYLSAFLQRELTEKLGSGKVFAFDSLGEAMKHLSDTSASKPQNLPTVAELKVIADEEQRAHPVQYRHTWAPTRCQKCQKEGTFIGGFAKPSRYGGWSYHYICTSCGLEFDSGESYDD